MNKIEKYIKERGFDENHTLVNNYNSKITIGNLLEGFDNLAEKQVKKFNISSVGSRRELLIAYEVEKNCRTQERAEKLVDYYLDGNFSN